MYDTMGRVSYSSLPYFEGLETPRWISYLYDPIGRVARVTNPDGTFVTKSYLLGTATSVDANGHKKEEDRDAYGQLIQVREYAGMSPNFTLYATTQYRYGTLGTLDNVTDAAGNVTRIGYDTLSRKTWMTDPDMGYWTYQYDANGNLSYQTDAKNQTIGFTYDALNRLTRKHYPAGPDVVYTYDELFSSNPKGRLTTVSDLSGTTKFYYDKLGRAIKNIKTVDGADYTTESTYDALGRTASIKYPDAGLETVTYTYDTGGNVRYVIGAALYAQYSNYNALGQAGVAVLGNNTVTTQYSYSATNNRLYAITTNNGQGQGLQNLAYAYDSVGNIQTITDLMDANRTQSFQYDDLNRIQQAQSPSYGTLTYGIDAIGNITNNSQLGTYTYNSSRPHAVLQAGPYTYSYDANGNMNSRWGDPLVYDYENRPSSITSGGTTVGFVYDYAGNRVKKITPSATTIYIGKLYECTSGVCAKHIFAGGNRIATRYPTVTYYYNTDHLHSSNVITDGTGAKVGEVYYYPFGGTRVNAGPMYPSYKYTGQEQDGETGLYFYGARYYDPAIGRFISADTIIPGPSNPQAFNRYSYVLNNPLLYTDPSGHGNFFEDAYHGAIRTWHDFERSRFGQVALQSAATIVGAVYGGAPGAALAAASVNYAYTEDMTSSLKAGGMTLVTYGAFNMAGDYIQGMQIAGRATNPGYTVPLSTKAIIHAGAGATAGGINAAIGGGNIGLGIVAGGFAGGVGSYFRGFAPYGSELAGHALIGGVAGGTVYSLYGGNFGEGFAQGAVTSVFELLFNQYMHSDNPADFNGMGGTKGIQSTIGYLDPGPYNQQFNPFFRQLQTDITRGPQMSFTPPPSWVREGFMNIIRNYAPLDFPAHIGP